MISALPAVAALALLMAAPQMGKSQPRGDAGAEEATAVPPGPLHRDYAEGLPEVREALEKLLDDAGLSPDPEAEAAEGEIVTGYVRFDRSTFGPNVAIPPPKMSPVYPYLQPRWMATGEYRLRINAEPVAHVVRVTLLAELRTRSYNSFTYEFDMIIRHSDRTIEKAMIQRLTDLLAPPPPDGE